MELSRRSLVEDEIKRWERVLHENLPPPPPLPMPPPPPHHPDDDEEEPWYVYLERELEADRIAQGLPPPPPPTPGLHGLTWTWTGGVWSPKHPAAQPQEAVWEGGPQKDDEEQQQEEVPSEHPGLSPHHQPPPPDDDGAPPAHLWRPPRYIVMTPRLARVSKKIRH